MNVKLLVFTFGLLIGNAAFAADKTTLRIGVQTYGTVDWELSALETDPSADFQLKIQHVANTEAGKIALQSGAVDIIVSDWLWVAKLRSSGSDFVFYPYSATSGALIVPNDSPIHSLADLKGKTLGVAGGELDKNWLLLQALGQQQAIDLTGTIKPTYAAPPLISEQLKQKRLDAALTYWHFAARLEAQGYRKIIDGKGILEGLGFTEKLPAIGYVFKQRFAEAHRTAVNQFLATSQAAKTKLCTSNAAWQKILPLTQADDAATQAKLRQGYCEGGIEQWTEQEQQAIAELYALLHKLGKEKLTGTSDGLPKGLFWTMD